MPQLLALEWNDREVRVALASGRERQAVIEQAFSISLPAGESGEEPSESEIGRRIAEALDARGIGRPETLVAVGRGSIELRQLQLPPAPDEELPDLVQFQAAREFNELNENWLLDFVPIDETADGPRTVLATAIAPAMLKRIEAVCEGAGIQMRRLLLRSCEAASLLAGARFAPPEQLRLLVDLLADEADLTAVAAGKAVFLRTTRFAGAPPPVPALLAEIRLTLAAVQNQLGGRKVESIVLCGRDGVHSELSARIQAELGLKTELFDPFGAVRVGPALSGALPEHAGRYAPLLGMLTAELQQGRHAIDYLHPRRKAEPPSRRRQWILAASILGVLALAWFVWGKIEHAMLAREVNAIAAENRRLDAKLDGKKKVLDNFKPVKDWVDGEVVWLDQLYDLTRLFPPAEEAVLGEWTCVVRPDRKMQLKGTARNDQVVTKMEERIRAAEGKIDTPSGKDNPSARPYPWEFETKLLLKEGAKR